MKTPPHKSKILAGAAVVLALALLGLVQLATPVTVHVKDKKTVQEAGGRIVGVYGLSIQKPGEFTVTLRPSPPGLNVRSVRVNGREVRDLRIRRQRSDTLVSFERLPGEDMKAEVLVYYRNPYQLRVVNVQDWLRGLPSPPD